VHDILLRSTDAGLTWDSLPTPIPSGIPYFITPLFAVSSAASQNGVWKTTDGGKHGHLMIRKSVADGLLLSQIMTRA